MSGLGATLTAAALLGTARTPLPDAAVLPEPLAGLARETTGASPEAQLLALAGAHALVTAAGRAAAIADDTDWRLPAYDAAAELPVCGAAAGARLVTMLNNQHAEQFPELLGLLAARGLRVPDELLPDLLDHGARLARLRGVILPVIGERGRWLAALNPRWRYASAALDDDNGLRALWRSEAGSRGWLYALLHARRPELARRLLAAAWGGATDVERRELLRLTTTVEPADEPFLERALDDRDSQVRRRASELLAGLPDSRLALRMTAAAGGILTMQGGRLVPVFPPVTDAMVRDGVARPAAEGTTPQARTRLILFTVGVIPLGHWPGQLGLDPHGVVRAALDSQWPRSIVTALAAAAGRQRDPVWARALVEVDGVSERTGQALPLLPQDVNEALLEQAIGAGDEERLVALLRRWSGPWPEPLARRLLDFLLERAAAGDETRHTPTLRYQTRALAGQFPTTLGDYLEERTDGPALSRVWELTLRGMTNLLRLRQEIVAAADERAAE